MSYMDIYNEWLNDSYFDESTKQELKSLEGNEKEIEDRFYKNLEFGTGGLRGILGAGTNRMNIHTVSKATQGLANYIIKKGGGVKNMSVVIAHDSRRMSPEFALAAALVLNGNGIKAYLFDELRPTPELSFAVRYLNCTAGIVITASHNPPEYNGYKAYWSDGAQIPYPFDEEIIEEVEKITSFTKIKKLTRNDAMDCGLLQIIGKEIDDAYIKNVKAQSLNAEVIEKMNNQLKIVYTPLHGTGNKPVRRALSEIGFNNVFVVPEQELPDPDFSTVAYPNPEDPKAFELAVALASKTDADLIVGTDPDADRVGVVVKNSEGEYVILTGNMTGTLLCEYILSQKKASGTLPQNGAVISTIVSSNMTREIASHYNVDYFEVLTGFKYIGEKMKDFEVDNSHSFLFGFEESYGSLAGTYCRDKDAVVSTMLVCEMAAYYKTRGMSLYEGLLELYDKYGFYKESIESITLKGVEGIANIKKIMNNLRSNPPEIINNVNVIKARDYKAQTILNIQSGDPSHTNLPVSDVLYYELADESWFCIRPSGTEPKIKIYFGVKDDIKEQAEAHLQNLVKSAMDTVNSANN